MDDYFSTQPELKKYFEDVAQRHDILEHVRFATEVRSATWDEADAMWTVEVATAGGVEKLAARAIVSAVGQLNRPMVPDFPGRDSFRGPAFPHRPLGPRRRPDRQARRPDRGRGQRLPSRACYRRRRRLADGVPAHRAVDVPQPELPRPVGPGVTWAMNHLPCYARWYRFLLLWAWCDKGLEPARVDPDWPDQHRSVSQLNEGVRLYLTDWIRGQLDGDEELAAEGAARLPAHRQTAAAGQRHLAAHPAPTPRRPRPRPD